MTCTKYNIYMNYDISQGISISSGDTYDSSAYTIKYEPNSILATTTIGDAASHYITQDASDGVRLDENIIKKITDMYSGITIPYSDRKIYEHPNGKSLALAEADGLVMRIYVIGYKHGSSREYFHAPNFQVVYDAKKKSFSLPEVAYENLWMSFMNDIMNSGSCSDKVEEVNKELCHMATCITDIYADGKVGIFYQYCDEVDNADYAKLKTFKKNTRFTEISW